MGNESQIKYAARLCKEAYYRCEEMQGDNTITGCYAEISGLYQKYGRKTLRALYPVHITCARALPTLPACQFVFLAISVELPSWEAKVLSQFKTKQKQQIRADLFYKMPRNWYFILLDYFLYTRQLREDMFAFITEWAGLKTNKSIAPLKVYASLVSVSPSGNVRILSNDSTGVAALPSKRQIKARCALLHKYFFNDYFLPAEDAVAHTGWVAFGHLPGFQHAMKVFAITTTIEDVFPQAMDHVTLPLFGYTLFSATKPFISSYPSRLSVQEPYATVQKKLKHVIFLSVSGERALEYSTFYAGTPLISKVPSAHTARIHDGVVIYAHKFKREMTRTIRGGELPKFLAQDACSLFINTNLPAHSGIISLSIPSHAPKLTDPSPVAFMVQSFTDWIETCYLNEYERAYHKCAHAIYKVFLQQYRNAAKDLFPVCNIPSEERFINELTGSPFFSFDLLITPLVCAFEELDEQLLFNPLPNSTPLTPSNAANKMKFPKQISTTLAGKIHKHQQITSIAMHKPTKAAHYYAEFYFYAKKVYDQHQKDVSLHIVDYEGALRILTESQKVDPQAAKSSAYLLAALLSYCEFLKQSGKDDAEVFRQRSIQAICNLCAKGPTDLTVDKAARLFQKYLSGLIVDGKIIPLRGEPQDKPVSGWYDGNKKLLCLPYATYFEDFAAYCEKEETLQIPYTKASLQELVLYPKGIVQPKENGSASQYFRPDCKIKVAPASLPTAPAETVIKLSIPALERIYPFSSSVLSTLYQMSCTPIKRRAIKSKE